MRVDKILKHITPNRVLDIGAHIGGFYDEISTVCPFFERYFAIEGNEYCETYLKSRNLECHIGLVGSKNGEVDFYRRKNNFLCTGSSIFRELSDAYSDEEILVDRKKISTIDSIFTKDDFFDLVKIDTQGYELEILKGGQILFRNCKAILLEVSLTPYNDGAPLYDDVKEFMSDFGFVETEIIGENRYVDGKIFQLDVLFIRKNN